ncbi:hypothetical protein ACI6QG_14410 [Roseococcus sp. DSY-14]|uniref:hypothetical protein n=1 Tax=Roseococcus sp. DSY-14 TaxID=3369650 RepID=UPI00387B8E0B
MSKALGRRQAGLLSAALAAGCAGPGRAQAQASGQMLNGAQVPPTTPVVLPLPLPCPRAPGDIVGALLEGPSEAGVLVFGQPFAPGEVPAGAGLAVRTADGRPLPAQLDVKVRHPDRSARHALVSLSVPALRQGERLGLLLARGPEAPGAPLGLGPALAGRQAVLEVTPLEGGAPWRVDLLAAWQSRREASPWQSGPLAVQERLTLPVPAAAVGGVASMRLVADMAVRADGTLWVDAWMRNDIAMQPDGGTAAYRLRLLLDGRPALEAELPKHLQYTGFGRLRGARPGGAPPPVAPFVRQDVNHLADTAAIPRYDQTTGVDARHLENMGRALADPEWEVPFNRRLVTMSMGQAGGRLDIGPLTGWQAQWLCSADRRVAAVALGQAETAGAVPWHFWDPGTGSRPAAWMDTRAWPNFWTDPRNGAPPRSLLQRQDWSTGWGPTRSHQPDLAFLPYLLSGRRAFLDEVLAQGVWNILNNWPAMRRPAGPGALLDDVIILNENQNRTHAWAMRQVDNAAWITPQGDPTGDYLRAVAATNWLWMRGKLPEWTRMQGESHGWMPGSYGTPGAMPPWQQDYFACTVAMAARRGSDDARVCLRWMTNFLVGRFFAEDKGFSRQDGVTGLLAITQPPPIPRGAPPLRSWADIAEATRARDFDARGTWRHSRADFSRWALQSLAQITETLGDERAREAYLWLMNSDAPFVTPQYHVLNAQANIVPKGMPRIPARQPGCA